MSSTAASGIGPHHIAIPAIAFLLSTSNATHQSATSDVSATPHLAYPLLPIDVHNFESIVSSGSAWFRPFVISQTSAEPDFSPVASWIKNSIEGNTRKNLFNALQLLRTSIANWDDDELIPPPLQSLSAAERALALMPDSYATPKLGMGDSGDIYFSWENAEGVAFLTIEPEQLHLLLKPYATKSIYLDHMPNDATVLENQILPSLEPFAAQLQVANKLDRNEDY